MSVGPSQIASGVGVWVRVPCDRQIAAGTKSAINRQMAAAEERRTALLAALENLHDDANGNLEGVAEIIRETFDAAARENLQAAATPEQYNRVVEQFVGAMVAAPDGTVSKRKPPAAVAKGGVSVPCNAKPLQRVIAGE